MNKRTRKKREARALAKHKRIMMAMDRCIKISQVAVTMAQLLHAPFARFGGNVEAISVNTVTSTTEDKAC